MLRKTSSKNIVLTKSNAALDFTEELTPKQQRRIVGGQDEEERPCEPETEQMTWGGVKALYR